MNYILDSEGIVVASACSVFENMSVSQKFAYHGVFHCLLVEITKIENVPFYVIHGEIDKTLQIRSIVLIHRHTANFSARAAT